MPNQSEGDFNCTQAHVWLLKIAILANTAHKIPQKMKIFHFCFRHLKDEDKPYLEQPLTQIAMMPQNLHIQPYSATNVAVSPNLIAQVDQGGQRWSTKCPSTFSSKENSPSTVGFIFAEFSGRWNFEVISKDWGFGTMLDRSSMVELV